MSDQMLTVVEGNSWRHSKTLKSWGFRLDWDRKIWFRMPPIRESNQAPLLKKIGCDCQLVLGTARDLFAPSMQLEIPIKRDETPLEKTGVYELYTDGGCWPNPGIGGWAFVLTGEGIEIEDAGGSREETTNNRMELMGPIMGLKRIPDNSKVTLITDSQYVARGLNEWRHNWKENNWLRFNGNKVESISNVDLWKKLDRETERFHEVKAVWVKGHAGNVQNERCDVLAGWAAYYAEQA